MKVDIVVGNTEIPKYATPGSAAVDLRAAIKETIVLHPERTVMIPTALKMAIPEGCFGLIAPRSGLGARKGIVLSNLVGVIDPSYRGEIMISLWNRNPFESREIFVIEPGDKLCQMMFVPFVQVSFNPVDCLDETERGEGGFGSTGRS